MYRFYVWIEADSRDQAIEILDNLQMNNEFISETDFEYEWDE